MHQVPFCARRPLRRRVGAVRAGFNTVAEAYRRLDLDRTACAKDIGERYRELAKRHHPDRSGGNEATMKELSAAYAIILKHLADASLADGGSPAHTKTGAPGPGPSPAVDSRRYALFPKVSVHAKAEDPPTDFPFKVQAEARYWAHVRGTPYFDPAAYSRWVTENFRDEQQAAAAVASVNRDSPRSHRPRPSRLPRTGDLYRLILRPVPHLLAALSLYGLWLWVTSYV